VPRRASEARVIARLAYLIAAGCLPENFTGQLVSFIFIAEEVSQGEYVPVLHRVRGQVLGLDLYSFTLGGDLSGPVVDQNTLPVNHQLTYQGAVAAVFLGGAKQHSHRPAEAALARGVRSVDDVYPGGEIIDREAPGLEPRHLANGDIGKAQ